MKVQKQIMLQLELYKQIYTVIQPNAKVRKYTTLTQAHLKKGEILRSLAIPL